MYLLVRRVALSLMFFAALAACSIRGQAQSLDELVESARAAQSSGDYEGAAKFYSRATVLAPNYAELWANRGIVEYLADHFDASAASMKHALQLNPKLFVPMLFLGKTYIQTGKPTQALPYLDHAHLLRPKEPEVLLALGKANADLKQPRQAASFYSDATRIAPENTEAWLGLGAASLEVITDDGRNLAVTQAQSPWARALYADELLAQGRPLEAIDKHKEALAAATPAQRATLIRTLQWMESHPELFPLPPNSQKALQQLDAQLKSEQDKEAPPTCAPAADRPHPSLPRSATDAAPPLHEAACAFWVGDYQRTAAQAAQVLHQSPQNPEALYWSVKANERLAVAALSRFEELAPHSATNYVLVGDLFRYQRQMDSALSEYRKALAIDAHDSAALLGAILANYALNNSDEAVTMDQTALTYQPLDPQLNLLMAEILARDNKFDQLQPYLARCVDAAPELQPRVHYLLSKAASEAGNTEEAIRQLELALPGDDDGSMHYQLSRLYRKAGNIAQAKQAEAVAKALILKRSANAKIAIREVTGTNP